MPHAPELIERIRAGTDIVALIGRKVALRRSGRNHMGRCPFHTERTPSFSVNQDKGMFYCFGCHQGGDVFAWVMQTEGLEFGDAVVHLAQRCGIELTGISPQKQALLRQQQDIKASHKALGRRLSAELWGKNGAPARAYLHQRQVPPEQARKFALGYVSCATRLCRMLMQEGQSHAQLMQAGLLADERQPARLLMHERLTFAIRDITGAVVGFGGRLLPSPTAQQDPHAPKYLNSKETVVFHKRAQLFGLFEAQEAIRKHKQIVVVEGFMDVLAAHRAGIGQTVAALGTALTPEHGKSCRRLTEEVVLMLDGDAAGERAAAKGALALMQAGLRVQLAWLPKGDDPASLVQRAGNTALSAVLDGARPALEALMHKAFVGAPATIEGRVLAARALMPLLDALGPSLERELYVERLAGEVGVSSQSLLQHWQQQSAGAKAQARVAPAQPREPKQPHKTAAPYGNQKTSQHSANMARQQPANDDASEWAMVCELLLYASLQPRLSQLLEYLQNPKTSLFVQALIDAPNLCEEELAVAIEAHVPRGPWQMRLKKLQPLQANDLDEGSSRANRTFEDILRRLKWRHVDAALKRVLGELRASELRGEATDALLRRKQQLTARKRTLTVAGK